MKRIESTILALSLMSMLSACGGSSDPMSKYTLREDGTPGQTREKQTLLQAGKISVELVADNASQTVVNNFVEGQASQVLLKVTVNDPKISLYTINLTQFPHIDQPSLIATAQPGIWSLTWTPPKGFIPPGQTGQALNINWEVKVTAATAPELIGYQQSGSFPINISRSTEVPTIISYDKHENGVEEDQLVPFTVVIDDPNSKSENQVPFLSFTGVPYLNTEAYCADFASRMIIDSSKSENPQRLSETRWKFYYRMDTRNLPIDRDRVGQENPNSPSVDVCFYLAAVSGVGQTTSAKSKINIKAKYSAKMPTLRWENDSVAAVTAGEEIKIRFEVGIETSQTETLGALSFPKQAAELARLSGTKSLQCDLGAQDSATKKTCELTWKPRCVSSKRDFQLRLTVANTVGTRKKEKMFTRNFEITPKAGCAN